MKSRPAVSPRERIAALARDDKWFLGGLDGVVWAPPFPRWLHRPGFWDPVHLLQHEVGPGFSVTLVRPDGRESPLHAVRRGPGGRESAALRWRPGRLDAAWSDERGVVVEERRQVLPGGILESSWQVPRELEGYLVGFTAQPADATCAAVATESGVGWTRTASDRRGQELVLRMELAGSVSPAWRSIAASEGRSEPEWRHSPFAEGGGSGRVGPATAQAAGHRGPGVVREGLDSEALSGTGADPDARRSGWIWLAVALPLAEIDDGRLANIRLTIGTRPAGARYPASRSSAPQPTTSSTVAATSSTPPADEASPSSVWESFFDGFPHFQCGDPFLDRYFDYRIYGLGLNRVEGRWGPIRHAAIAEGPEYFHVPITYSAQCHMMEMRWRSGTDARRGARC